MSRLPSLGRALAAHVSPVLGLRAGSVLTAARAAASLPVSHPVREFSSPAAVPNVERITLPELMRANSLAPAPEGIDFPWSPPAVDFFERLVASPPPALSSTGQASLRALIEADSARAGHPPPDSPAGWLRVPLDFRLVSRGDKGAYQTPSRNYLRGPWRTGEGRSGGMLLRMAFAPAELDVQPVTGPDAELFETSPPLLGGGVLRGLVKFGETCEGPPSCIHGGAVATLLDTVLGNTVWFSGYPVATASLNVHYKKFVPGFLDLQEHFNEAGGAEMPGAPDLQGGEYAFWARVTSVAGRKVHVEGALCAIPLAGAPIPELDLDGPDVHSTGSGMFIRLKGMPAPALKRAAVQQQQQQQQQQ
ncbi:hypothetical protein H696_00959 [Fonticula alba]|uniref:Thioesterase domain-containing protein n=1 Tax=Fonticula alba TaxID=691883 RepID=A0A058ZIS9_FONAL|nr:hypothetical protein H696_00959 [Fonticula alba]KCV73422.1 hypothetical protein H696_00959 [Fonticula alba]|eukprot:XP_009493123.1 hypothetical protein H696_00959 [Fonticula alba]